MPFSYENKNKGMLFCVVWLVHFVEKKNSNGKSGHTVSGFHTS